MRLRRFFKRLNRYYPEMAGNWRRLALAYRDLPGADCHPAAALIEDLAEQCRARSALEAIFEDSEEGMVAALREGLDKKISQDECGELVDNAVHLGVCTAFMLGVWVAQAGFARFRARAPAPPEDLR